MRLKNIDVKVSKNMFKVANWSTSNSVAKASVYLNSSLDGVIFKSLGLMILTFAVYQSANAAIETSYSSPAVSFDIYANSIDEQLDDSNDNSRNLDVIDLNNEETYTPATDEDFQTFFEDLEEVDSVDNEIAIDDQVISTSEFETEEGFLEEVTALDSDSDYVSLNAISPQTIATFVEVFDIVRNEFVTPVSDEALFEHAIHGMLENLDSHAEYLTSANYEQLRNFTDGEIGHVGLKAQFDEQKQIWVITDIEEGSSAKEAGLTVGDQLFAIKQVELLTDMSSEDIDQLLSGIAGSQVDVTYRNEQGWHRHAVLQRNLSANNELEMHIDQGIAVIRLPVFQNNSKDQLLDLLRTAQTPISGIVLDVRNNPGGVLSAAIDIASLFIADKGLIEVRNRTNSSQILNPNGTPYLSSIPLILLQNKYSASASEVLSSSLQTNGRASIVGETSFGKGSVQEVIPLQSGGAVKLTVAEYYSAKGDPINGVGVTPDVILKHDGEDWQHQAVELLLSQNRPLMLNLDEDIKDIAIEEDY